VPLTFTLGGVPGAQTLYLAVQNGSLAAPVVNSLTLTTATIGSGGTVTGTVTLTSAAPTGGAVVTLSSSSNAAIVPSSVTVQAGATSATFTVTAGPVSAATSATITASYGGGSAQATLTVTPSSGGGNLPPFSEIIISATFPGATVSSGIRFAIEVLSLDGFQACSMSGSEILGIGSGYTYAAGFSGFTANGLTLTCTGFKPTGSEIVDFIGDIAQFSSASLTVTLTPQVISTSGTVTGSINLVSTLATISGSFSGTFTAQ
jgi:hypothetical protein